MFKLNKITNFLDTHPIGQIFNLGNKKAVWKKVTGLATGVKIAIEKDGELEWDEIVSVKKVGRERVYDIEVEGTHNFVANGILAHNTHLSLTSTGDLNIEKVAGTDQYAVRNTQDNSFIDKVGAFSKLLAADFEAGIAVISGKLISPIVQTDLISPLADSDTLTIRTKNLVIENASGSAEVKVVGDLTAENASISGELYAGSIVSPDLDKIQELLRQVKTDQDLLAQASTWNTQTATTSSQLDSLTAGQLFVTDQATISSLSVANSLSLGTDLVFQSSSIQYPVSSINTLQAPLAIQSLAMAPIEIMAGKIIIATNGDVTINANLYVAGKIESESVKTKEITTEKLIIATSPTSEVSTTSGTIKTNATAGSATIPAGLTELEIENSKIENSSLIYVTPTSSTNNNVLYVKSKENGKFTVGFNNPLDVDVTFNWWVVEVK